jgi:ABC-type microcin C transport system permease subunit YejE
VASTDPTPDAELEQQRSYLEIVERQFQRNQLAVWGLRVVIFLILVSIFAPFLANDKPLVFHGYRY